MQHAYVKLASGRTAYSKPSRNVRLVSFPVLGLSGSGRPGLRSPLFFLGTELQERSHVFAPANPRFNVTVSKDRRQVFGETLRDL
jgi:hypothetical protein